MYLCSNLPGTHEHQTFHLLGPSSWTFLVKSDHDPILPPTCHSSSPFYCFRDPGTPSLFSEETVGWTLLLYDDPPTKHTEPVVSFRRKASGQ